jgi:hypothetical protein
MTRTRATPPSLIAILSWDEADQAKRMKRPLILICAIMIFVDYAQLPLTELRLFGVSFGGAQAERVLAFAAVTISILFGGWLLYCARDLLLLYHGIVTHLSIQDRYRKSPDEGPRFTPEAEIALLKDDEDRQQEARRSNTEYEYGFSNHLPVLVLKGTTVVFQVGGTISLYVIALRSTTAGW